jgi:hypothetical protein
MYQRLGRDSGDFGVATVAVHEQEREGALNQQHYLGGSLSRSKRDSEPQLDSRLVPSGDLARRMTGQIRKLHDEPCKTRTGPASAAAPYR